MNRPPTMISIFPLLRAVSNCSLALLLPYIVVRSKPVSLSLSTSCEAQALCMAPMKPRPPLSLSLTVIRPAPPS